VPLHREQKDARDLCGKAFLPMKPQKSFSIQKMVQLLNMRKNMKRRTILFLGARTGGLFRSQAFYKDLKPFSLRDFSDMDDFEKFAECYRLLSRSEDFSETDIDTILTNALREVKVAYIDICIAELLKQGIFDLVITTCIDDILEQALIYMGQQRNFSTFVPGRDPSTQNRSMQLGLGRNDTIKIWKVFGDILSCSYYLPNRISHVQEHSDLRSVLEETRARDILMVGFDPVWDGDLVSTLFPRTASPHSFWYVNAQKPEEGSALSQYLEDCGAKCINGVEGNHENFFQKLYLDMTGKLPAPYQIEQELHQINNELAYLRQEVQQLILLLQGENNQTKPAELE
jgi:hypothetical protein